MISKIAVDPGSLRMGETARVSCRGAPFDAAKYLHRAPRAHVTRRIRAFAARSSTVT
jgi:hypothetical protein